MRAIKCGLQRPLISRTSHSRAAHNCMAGSRVRRPTSASATGPITSPFSMVGRPTRCHRSPAFIGRNVIVANTANDFGGGLECYGASPEIRNNLLAGNLVVSSGYGGGGISCFAPSTPLIVGNRLLYNRAKGT